MKRSILKSYGRGFCNSNLNDQRANREFKIARCLDAVSNPGTGNTLCKEAYPPVEERGEVLAFFAFPLFLCGILYGFWRVVSWISRGFRDQVTPPR